MNQLGLVLAWQARCVDLEAALREARGFIAVQGDDKTDEEMAMLDRIDTALAVLDADKREAGAILTAATTKGSNDVRQS